MKKISYLMPILFLCLTGFRFGTVNLGEETGEEFEKTINKALQDANTNPNPNPDPPVDPPTVPQKGNRILGLDIGAAEDGDFTVAMMKATSAGVESTGLLIYWDEMETSTSPVAYNPVFNSPAVANAFYPSNGLKVNIKLAVVDTERKRLPVDLMNKPYDDPEILSRFQSLIDWMFTQMPDLEIVSFSIGNEIDFVLESAADYQQYETFVQNAAAYVRTKRANMPVGAVATLDGLLTDDRLELQSLNTHSDVILVTYYPLNSDFTMQDPSIVSSDISSLVALYPNTPIYFTEAGYSTGNLNNSSETKQAQFVENVFSEWDKFINNIRMINFTWQTDVSQQQINDWEIRFGISDPAFLSYLGTLGLRTHGPGSGVDKLGFIQLGNEAAARGW